MTTQRVYRTSTASTALPVSEDRIRKIAKQTSDELEDIAPIIRAAVQDIENYTRLRITAGTYVAMFRSSVFGGIHSDAKIVLPGVNTVLESVKDGETVVDASRYRTFYVDVFDGLQIVPLADWDWQSDTVTVTFTAGSDNATKVPENVVNLIGVRARYLVHGEPDDYDLVMDVYPEVEYREVA